MEAIILAGGFGTRLRHIVADVPKPMADVCGKPFLQYIIDDLIHKGIKRIIIAVGYKKEYIIDYFGDSYKNIEILYSSEDTPLFTGGAIKKALGLCTAENVLIVNGDTFFDVDIPIMLDEHKQNNNDITIAIKHMTSFDRYGSVEVKDDKVIRFYDKQYKENGYINGGIYILKIDIFKNIDKIKFSFEEDILEKLIYKTGVYKSDGYFIDIGIQQDYFKANREFKDEK